MLPQWLEIIGSILIAAISLLLIIRTLFRNRYGRELWKLYKSIFQEIGVYDIVGSKTSHGMPNIFGKINDRRIYIHPVSGKKKSTQKNTTIAVEHGLDISEDIVISWPETASVEDEAITLKVDNINKYDYLVLSRDGSNEKLANKLFNKKVSTKIHRIIKKNGKQFRAIIIESGLALFSIFGWDFEKSELKDSITDIIRIVEGLEKNSEEIKEEIKNERLDYFSKKSKRIYGELIYSGALIGISVYLIKMLLQEYSLLFLTISVVFITTALVRAFDIYTTKEYL
ncbi:MAG: hypothetical protein ACOC85_01995 [Thermoplasmatota archaeon]